MINTSKSVTRIAVLTKAINVMNYVSSQPEGCCIKQIAYALKLNISSCYHIVNTLIDGEYLEKCKDERLIVGAKVKRL